MEQQLNVTLELTVPRILYLAKTSQRGAALLSHPAPDEQSGLDTTEGIRIVTLSDGEATDHEAIECSEQKLHHGVSFQVFRIEDVHADGGTLLCQILRDSTGEENKLRLTDEVVCRLAVRSIETVDAVEEKALFDPDIHDVTLYIDAEGIPITYRIDGAES